MWAGLGRSHTPAPFAIEGMLEEEGGDAQLFWSACLKDPLGIIGAVIVSHPSVVPADDEMAASIILSYNEPLAKVIK